MVRALRIPLALLAVVSACGAPALTFEDTNSPPIRDSGGDASIDSGVPGDERNFPADDRPAPTNEANSDAATPEAESDASPEAQADGPISTCSNGVKDGDETGVDCGGVTCARCSTGASCTQDRDCISAFCQRDVCAQASCIDGVKNLRETDIDCGGGDCPPCGAGKVCVSYMDCALLSCANGTCQSMSCTDGMQGPGETDVDCGGPSCAPCVPGKRCAKAGDCTSSVCGTSGLCVTSTCGDGVLNGNESAVDCGGSCPKCAAGLGCGIGSDCASGVCAGRICQMPSCTDHVTNGGETDVDCGGPCGKCGPRKICNQDTDCTSANCAGICQTCPKDMIEVPLLSGASSYCVDPTEVTVAGYDAFIRSNPSTALLPAACAMKTSFQPGRALDLNNADQPVTDVDWCDAYAYCAQLNRHLCGRIGGGSLAMNETADATKSEWHNACSRGGVQSFPYQGTYAQTRCVDKDVNAIRPVRSATMCEGGYAGLYDMSGNVAEWEDACMGSMGMMDQCRLRGGAYNDNENALACGAGGQQRRSTRDQRIGFRCCL